jgi:GTP-binding protein
MIENYLSTREHLAGLVLVMDSRREWTKDEELLKAYTDSRGLPLCVVLTKSDKLTRSESQKCLAAVKKAAAISAVFMTSALKKTGHKEAEDFLYENWIKE